MSVYRWVHVHIQNYNGVFLWLQFEDHTVGYGVRTAGQGDCMVDHRAWWWYLGVHRVHHMNKRCSMGDTGSFIGCAWLSTRVAWVITWALSGWAGWYKRGWMFKFGVSATQLLLQSTPPVPVSSCQLLLPQLPLYYAAKRKVERKTNQATQPQSQWIWWRRSSGGCPAWVTLYTTWSWTVWFSASNAVTVTVWYAVTVTVQEEKEGEAPHSYCRPGKQCDRMAES